jgi:hypothetical protein
LMFLIFYNDFDIMILKIKKSKKIFILIYFQTKKII